jgi:CRP/FNR family cyclic AMP-dependent transcriptional regulator
MDGVTARQYGAQRVVCAQGDAATAVFYVLSGQVKLTVMSRQGKEAVVAILEADDFFGEGCLVGQTRVMATATTMTTCTLWRIAKKTIVRMLDGNPRFSNFFLKHLLTRTIRLQADLVDHLFNSAEKRLARALLLLAHFGKTPQREVMPKISQGTLASMIGTTRERVSFFMNRFKKLGFLEYNGGLRVHSSLLTVVLNDLPETDVTTGAGQGDG